MRRNSSSGIYYVQQKQPIALAVEIDFGSFPLKDLFSTYLSGDLGNQTLSLGELEMFKPLVTKQQKNPTDYR